MKNLLISCLITLTFCKGYTQVSPSVQLSDTARMFGKDIISTGDFEFDASFTPDSRTVFFCRSTINFGYVAIFYSTQNGSGWSKPEPVNFTGIYRDADPFVSADGRRLYFSSDRPVDGKPFTNFDYRFFYVELDGNKVTSQPVPFNLPLPDGFKPLYLSLADNGDAYFFSLDSNKDADIYMCAYQDGKYLPPVSLSFNDKKFFDYDAVIARDESFIIFASTNRKGYGLSDLFVSFKKGNTWSDPVNMGNKVNTSGLDNAPGLSRDNKTLYFSSFREKMDRPQYKNSKVTAKAILDILHSTKNGLRNIYEISISDMSESSSNK